MKTRQMICWPGLLLLLLGGCGDSTLDRATAKEILERFPSGNANLGQIKAWLLVRPGVHTKELEALEFIKDGKRTETSKLYLQYYGKMPEEEFALMRPYGEYPPLSKKSNEEFNELLDFTIEGVLMEGENRARVKFGWSRRRLPELWHSIVQIEGDGEAIMERYDDGWRLGEVTLKNSTSAVGNYSRIIAFHVEQVLPCAKHTGLKLNWAAAEPPTEWNPGQPSAVEIAGQVRCEATGDRRPAANRFVAGGDIVTDTQTGLTWPAQDNGGDTDWNGAGRYCTALGSGWTLPTVAELSGLKDESGTFRQACGGDTCAVTPAIRLSANEFWSGESNGSSEVWSVYFGNWSRRSFPAVNAYGPRVLCVRRS